MAVELPDANSESATGRPQVVRTGVEIPIGLLGVSDGSLDVPTVVRDEIELRTDPFQGPREALDRKRAQQADSNAQRGGPGGGKVPGAHGPAHSRRSFRRS